MRPGLCYARVADSKSSQSLVARTVRPSLPPTAFSTEESHCTSSVFFVSKLPVNSFVTLTDVHYISNSVRTDRVCERESERERERYTDIHTRTLSG